MQLFYSPELTLPTYTLSEKESSHAVKVLRMKNGDNLNITEGRGNMHLAQIVDANAKHCKIEILSTHENFEKRNYQITIAVAPTKNNDRTEWFAEKATEVGVDSIIPILCEHSERKVLNWDRLDKVIVSAMKQSLKAYKPELARLTPLAELIKTPFEGRKLIAHCHDVVSERKLIKDVVKAGENVMILIGPEGDFSPSEVELAFEHGFKPVSLGGSRLRTETAALASVMNVAFINS